MKTINLMTSFLGNDTKSPYYNRHILWLDYMYKLKGNLKFSDIWFIDNASNIEVLKTTGGEVLDTNFNIIVPATTHPDLHFVRFEEHLTRKSIWDYPYIFRAYQFEPKLIKHIGCDKVLFIDSDYYVLTQRFVDIINNIDSGFVSLKDPKYNFNLAALCFLCRDSFDIWFDFCLNTNFDDLKTKDTIEVFIPFTKILTGINGGQYGTNNLTQTPEMDYYGQTTGQKLVFSMGGL